MGYTHFWKRPITFEREAFAKAMEDVRMIIEHGMELGLHLSGPTGSGKPELTSETIAFNGTTACGHRYQDLGKPFASVVATGVEEKDPPYDATAAPWFSGPFLDTRVCGGTCSAEPFVVDRQYLIRDWERPDRSGWYYCSCETDFKPYDLMVTAAIVRLKERLGNAIVVTSVNPDHGFDDAKRLCRELFGWAGNFEVKVPEVEVLR